MQFRAFVMRRWINRFLGDQQGAVAVMVGMMMVMLVGFAALTVDGGYLYWTRTQLQATADSACLAGAAKLPQNNGTLAAADRADVIAEALAYVEKNMTKTAYGTVLASSDIVLGFWDAKGAHGAARTFYPEGSLPSGTSLDAITVTTRQDTNNSNSVSLLFAPVLGIDEMEVVTAATCWTAPDDDSQACVLSLHPTQDGAIEMSGQSTLDLDDCGIALHSSSQKLAFKISGTVDLTVGEVCVKGDPGVEQGGTVTWTPGPASEHINTGCKPPADPLSIAEGGPNDPTVGACDETDFKIDAAFTTATLWPGVYCGGIEISGSNFDVTFQPGIYILKGKGLKIAGSDGTLTGAGIMFYNTDDGGSYGNIEFSGSNNVVTLSAPTSGDYAGILFFQDRNAPADEFSFKASGKNPLGLDGVIYMPDQLVEFSGDSNLVGPCGVKIIASTIKLNGNSTVDPTTGSGCASDNVVIPLGEKLVLVM